MGQTLIFVGVNMWLWHIFGDGVIKVWLVILSICSCFAIYLMWPYLGMMWDVTMTILYGPIAMFKFMVIAFRG
jgi:hypothetical protein